MKRSCRELLYRGVSYGGPVKRSCESSCEDISHRGLVKRSCRELLYRDLS